MAALVVDSTLVGGVQSLQLVYLQAKRLSSSTIRNFLKHFALEQSQSHGPPSHFPQFDGKCFSFLNHFHFPQLCYDDAVSVVETEGSSVYVAMVDKSMQYLAGEGKQTALT